MPTTDGMESFYEMALAGQRDKINPVLAKLPDDRQATIRVWHSHMTVDNGGRDFNDARIRMEVQLVNLHPLKLSVYQARDLIEQLQTAVRFAEQFEPR